MSSSYVRPLAPACLVLAIMVSPAGAQGLQPIEETEGPATVIDARPAPQTSTTETRLPGGRVTEIEVRSGGSTYYLHPQTATGGAQRGRTAQWNILTFDAPRGPAPAAQGIPAPAPVPPPPRAN